MKATTFFSMLLLLLLTGCKRYYTVAGFDEKTAEHQTIAVLPFEMIYSGIPPRDLTQEDIERIEAGESRAFQASFFDAILASTRRGKKQLRVDVQHYSKTLSILKDNEIGILDSWDKNPEELADLLGVDAVVKGRIEKTRYMSDLASYGIEVGTQVISILTNNQFLPFINNRNKNVRTGYTLINKDDGNALWSIAYEFNADWRSNSNDIVDGINAKSARRFPYRVSNR